MQSIDGNPYYVVIYLNAKLFFIGNRNSKSLIITYITVVQLFCLRFSHNFPYGNTGCLQTKMYEVHRWPIWKRKNIDCPSELKGSCTIFLRECCGRRVVNTKHNYRSGTMGETQACCTIFSFLEPAGSSRQYKGPIGAGSLRAFWLLKFRKEDNQREVCVGIFWTHLQHLLVVSRASTRTSLTTRPGVCNIQHLKKHSSQFLANQKSHKSSLNL